MDTPAPQVRVPGETTSTRPEANAAVTPTTSCLNVTEVEMGGAQDPATSQSEPIHEDATPQDVQLEAPTPAKKDGGFNFLE
jgi:hypothetical protein